MKVEMHSPLGLRERLPKTYPDSSYHGLLTADTHASRRIWDKCPVEGDAAWGMRQIEDFVLPRHDFLIVAGDVADVAVLDSTSAKMLHAWIDRVTSVGCPVLMVHGQHDAALPSWAEALGAWHLPSSGPWAVPAPDFSICGYDFTPQHRCAEIFGSNEAKFVVAHQRWGELVPHQESAHLTLKDVSHARLVMSGDTHVLACKPGKNAEGRPAWLVSPGCTHKRAADEPDQHYFLELRISNDGEEVDIYPRRLHSRLVRSVRIGGRDDVERLAQTLPALRDESERLAPREAPAQILTPVLNVYVDPGVRIDKRDLRRVSEECGVAIRYVVPKGEGRAEAEAVEEDCEDAPTLRMHDPRELVLEILQERLRDKPTAFALAKTLAELPEGTTKGDIEDALDAWLAVRVAAGSREREEAEEGSCG